MKLPWPKIKMNKQRQKQVKRFLQITCASLSAMAVAILIALPPPWGVVGASVSAGLGVLTGFLQLIVESKESPAPSAPSISIANLSVNFLPNLGARNYENEKLVKELYDKVTKEERAAFALTGAPGVGKSTLAAQVYQYARDVYTKNINGLTKKDVSIPVWIPITENFTVSDLVARIMSDLGQKISNSNFKTLPIDNQITALVNVLNTHEEPHLVVLDQFETVLLKESLHQGPGVQNFLDALNRQTIPSPSCRVLLTAPTELKDIYGQSFENLEDYPFAGFTAEQSLEFLQKQLGLQVDIPDDEKHQVEAALNRYEGNALALRMLTIILQKDHVNLLEFARDKQYSLLWDTKPAKLLKYIYQKYLTIKEQNLLVAFSVFREEVSFEAALASLAPDKLQTLKDTQGFSVPGAQTYEDALVSLILLGLLTGDKAKRRYQLHPVIASFARDYFDPRNEKTNVLAKQQAHGRVARYYERESFKNANAEIELSNADLLKLVEAVWHYCAAAEWSEAYKLMERTDLFKHLVEYGAYGILLELYLLILPENRWQPRRLYRAHIYSRLGEIYLALGQYDEAMDSLKRALPLLKDEHDIENEARVLDNLGYIYYLQARDLLFWLNLDHRWELFTSTKKVQLPVVIKKFTLEPRKKMQVIQVYLDYALRYLEQALDIQKEEGSRRTIAMTAYHLGLVYDVAKEEDLAREHYEEALSIFRERGDRKEEAEVLYHLGWFMHRFRRKYGNGGRELLHQALRIQHEEEDVKNYVVTLDKLGRLYEDFGDIQMAWNYYKQALILERQIGDRKGTGITLYNIAVLYYALSKHEDFVAVLFLSYQVFDEIHQPTSGREERQINKIRQEIQDQKLHTWLQKFQKLEDLTEHVGKAFQQDILPSHAARVPVAHSFVLPNSGSPLQPLNTTAPPPSGSGVPPTTSPPNVPPSGNPP